MNYLDPHNLLRQSQLTALIETVCQGLEISPSQNQLARQRYETVGDWLARADDPLLASIAIRLQGSVAIGTTVKPIGAGRVWNRRRNIQMKLVGIIQSPAPGHLFEQAGIGPVAPEAASRTVVRFGTCGI